MLWCMFNMPKLFFFLNLNYVYFFILFVGNSTSVSRSRAQRVAFFVGLNSNINGVQNDEDVKFENVITNVGDCYNPETGRFRVPVDGVYQFNIAVAAQGRRKVLFSQRGRMNDLNLVRTNHWSLLPIFWQMIFIFTNLRTFQIQLTHWLRVILLRNTFKICILVH